jgi:fumarate hydratase subunit beta
VSTPCGKNIRALSTPLDRRAAQKLRAGDQVLISGTLYLARDAAHQRMVALIKNKKPLPFDVRGQIIFYAGPSPARPGQCCGAIGPTSSYRMDPYTASILAQGVLGIIGKGDRSADTYRVFQRHGAVYFVAVGGVAALLAQRVTASEVVAWPELGAEAVRRLTVRDFPVIVAQDAQGRNVLARRKILS